MLSENYSVPTCLARQETETLLDPQIAEFMILYYSSVGLTDLEIFFIEDDLVDLEVLTDGYFGLTCWITLMMNFLKGLIAFEYSGPRDISSLNTFAIASAAVLETAQAMRQTRLLDPLLTFAHSSRIGHSLQFTQNYISSFKEGRSTPKKGAAGSSFTVSRTTSVLVSFTPTTL